MGLQGNLRELQLHEVFQLLAHTRKSGTLRIRAQVAGRQASVTFEGGAIVHAAIWASDSGSQDARATEAPGTLQQLEDVALDLLTWRDGAFAFSPADPATRPARQTLTPLNTQAVLVKGAQRMAGWARLDGRMQYARTVPALADVDSRTLPVLQLTPAQWELLVYVDGARDLAALAAASGRDVVEVAEAVDALVETGVLVLLDTPRTARTHATPPSSAAQAGVPDHASMAGVVALPEHQRLGDVAARRGDFAEAIACWERALEGDAEGPHALRARESIALVTRLGVLLAAGET